MFQYYSLKIMWESEIALHRWCIWKQVFSAGNWEVNLITQLNTHLTTYNIVVVAFSYNTVKTTREHNPNITRTRTSSSWFKNLHKSCIPNKETIEKCIAQSDNFSLNWISSQIVNCLLVGELQFIVGHHCWNFDLIVQLFATLNFL